MTASSPLAKGTSLTALHNSPLIRNLTLIPVPTLHFRYLTQHSLSPAGRSPLLAKNEAGQREEEMLNKLEKEEANYQANENGFCHSLVGLESSGNDRDQADAWREVKYSVTAIIARQSSSLYSRIRCRMSS